MAVVLALALLSGMGVGNAGLLVVYLTAVGGLPQIEAQFVNLCLFILSSAASLTLLAGRRSIRWNLILLMSAAGIAGGLIGALLAPVLPPLLLRRLFGLMLLISGLPALLNCLRSLIPRGKNS